MNQLQQQQTTLYYNNHNNKQQQTMATTTQQQQQQQYCRSTLKMIHSQTPKCDANCKNTKLTNATTIDIAIDLVIDENEKKNTIEKTGGQAADS